MHGRTVDVHRRGDLRAEIYFRGREKRCAAYRRAPPLTAVPFIGYFEWLRSLLRRSGNLPQLEDEEETTFCHSLDLTRRDGQGPFRFIPEYPVVEEGRVSDPSDEDEEEETAALEGMEDAAAAGPRAGAAAHREDGLHVLSSRITFSGYIDSVGGFTLHIVFRTVINGALMKL